MKLPNLDSYKPVYKTILPSTKEEVIYSSYTVDQQKSIYITAQEKNNSAIFEMFLKILNDCCDKPITTLIDFVWMTTHIQAKSESEYYEFIIPKCDECDQEKIKVKINNIIENLEIKNEDKREDFYEISGTPIGLKLKSTSIDFVKEIKDDTNEIEVVFNTIANSVSCIVVKEDIIKEFDKQELIDNIIKKLSPKQIEEIYEKISNLISVKLKFNYICPKCLKTFEKEREDFLFLS